MINANELRISNKVKQAFATLTVLELYTEKCLCTDFNRTNICTYKKLDPIPLTPEILIACGFKYGKVDGISSFEDDSNDANGVTHYWDIRINGTELIESHSISLVKWGEQEYFTFQLERGFYRQKIKYLHTLMNLFYTLTGTELKYKP